MTTPLALDMEAVKRRARWCDEDADPATPYREVMRLDRVPFGFKTASCSDEDAYLDRLDLIAEVDRLENERRRYLGALGYILANDDFSSLVRGFVVNMLEETPGAACSEERNDAMMIKIANELRAAEAKK